MVVPFGSVIKVETEMVESFGPRSVIKVEGAMVVPFGSVIKVETETVVSVGPRSVIKVEGATVVPHGSVIKAERAMVVHPGSVIKAERATVVPLGSATEVDTELGSGKREAEIQGQNLRIITKRGVAFTSMEEGGGPMTDR